MAPDPLNEPSGDDDVDALRAQRDALEQRAEEAEAVAERLADELLAARGELADRTTDGLTLFDDAPTTAERSRAADGSEPGVVPIALGGTGAVALLVALLSWSNNGLLKPITLVMFVAAAVLLRVAWATRVVPTDVTISDGGVVSIVRKGETQRFDLASPTTRVEVLGRPDDRDWRVRLYRRALAPCDVDASMVDPETFLAQLRAHRPDL